MFKYLKITILISLSLFSGFAQEVNIKDYQGNWEGTLSNSKSFNYDITLEYLETNNYNLTLSNTRSVIHKKVASDNQGRIKANLDHQIHLDLIINKKNSIVNGFIKSGILMYHVSLKKTSNQKYKGLWNPFMIDNLQSQSVYLSVEDYGKDGFALYPFFGDQRFTGTWCMGFSKKDNVVLFRDYKTGMKFKATLVTSNIELEMILGETVIAKTNLSRSKSEWKFEKPKNRTKQSITRPILMNDGWDTATIQKSGIKPKYLLRMIDSVSSKSLINTHSVLIAKDNKLVFEEYFDGFNAYIVHDQRSASKSISSAMIGIAIDDKKINDVEEKLYDFLSEPYLNYKDSLKSDIKIKDLLTMSSGLDAIDFGIDRNSVASENNYQSSNDWLKTVMKAPMIHKPGIHSYYGSANPFLLGVCLNERLKAPLEIYMDKTLLSPLGITNYIIQTENTGTTPYFGGGMYLTPRDMLKFGQLYLDKGKWNGKQIISENWVNDSFKKHLVLENTNEKNEYGYLWWHKTYVVKNKKITSVEARGAGGQYIMVIPELNVVIAITSGNFRNGKFQQPEKIVEDYILPSMIK